MKKRMPLIETLPAFVLLAAAVLGCSSSGGRTCTAVLTRSGQTFTGSDKAEKQAKQNACNKYCRDADPGYEARYGIWLDSPKGRAAGRPSKEEAIYKDKDLLDYVTITCANQCVAEADAGKYKMEVNCK